MKVAMDVRTVTEVRSGVGNYVLNLLRCLRQEGPREEWYLVGQEKNLNLLNCLPQENTCHTTRISHESHPLGDIWEHYWLPRVLERAQVDVMHGPATLIPLTNKKYASVVTVHDLVAYLYPETIPHKYAVYMRWLLRKVVKRADLIISVSHSTKQDLIDILKVEPERIVVVHEAAQASFRYEPDEQRLARVCRHHGIYGPFIYHVGNIEPRKNLLRLLRAFLSLREQLKDDVRLVITGQKGWLTSKLFGAMKQMDLGDWVVFTGYVPHEHLPLLMNAAEAFVFPSLYEGFGLPVLEAMSCGTPVLTSDISSLPEIVGNAALLVDPTDEDAIAAGIKQLLEDTELRRRLAAAGLEQASRFSWQRAARETLAVYRQARG